MKAKTELLLYQLLWLGDQLTPPTFRKLSGSFETWAYSSGLLRTINRLEHEKWLETQGKSMDRVIRLTRKSRHMLTGKRDPEVEWSKKWDGVWRMALFDIPESKRGLRSKIRNILRINHFGCLQKSAWISPHPIDSIKQLINQSNTAASSFTLMECKPLPDVTDSDMVESAWDFSAINAKYEAYLQHLKLLRGKHFFTNADRLIAEEKRLWESAIKQDPLLPQALLPHGYLGKKTYQLRKRQLPKIINSLVKNQPQQDNSPDDRTY